MNKSLHIIFLCSWYPSRVLLNNGDFIQRHAEAVSLKNKVTVIHVITDDNLFNNIEITDNRINKVRTLIAYIKPTKNPIIKILRFKSAYRLLLLKVDNYDVVHVNKLFSAGLVALGLKFIKKIPFIVTEHHSIYHKPYNNKIGVVEKLLSKLIVKNASFICPVSDDLGKAMVSFGLKGNYNKIPNVVDTSVFLPKTKINNEEFTLLHISSMVKLKNVQGILNVVKKIQNKIPFHFNFIGGDEENFNRIAARLDINMNNVTFINFVPHHDLSSFYKKATVFILFSDTENLPCVILESFSCGTPVISSDVGGISEYFPDDFGLLIEPKNEAELLEAILKVYKENVFASPIKMYNFIEDNFSKKEICNQFSDLYRKSLLK